MAWEKRTKFPSHPDFSKTFEVSCTTGVIHHLVSESEYACNTYSPHVVRRRQWQPTPVLLPGKSRGRKSLLSCSLWGRKESDTTEWIHFHFSLSCIGEGNGNPLQCSCLENPRDGGAWWAAVYGVTQSRTLLSDLAAAAATCNMWSTGSSPTSDWEEGKLALTTHSSFYLFTEGFYEISLISGYQG